MFAAVMPPITASAYHHRADHEPSHASGESCTAQRFLVATSQHPPLTTTTRPMTPLRYSTRVARATQEAERGHCGPARAGQRSSIAEIEQHSGVRLLRVRRVESDERRQASRLPQGKTTAIRAFEEAAYHRFLDGRSSLRRFALSSGEILKLWPLFASRRVRDPFRPWRSPRERHQSPPGTGKRNSSILSFSAR